MRLELGEQGGTSCRTANFCPMATVGYCFFFAKAVIEHFRGSSVESSQYNNNDKQAGVSYDADADKIWTNEALSAPAGPFAANSYPLCADS
eukprot:3154664-Prymnesium_polylepis.1